MVELSDILQKYIAALIAVINCITLKNSLTKATCGQGMRRILTVDILPCCQLFLVTITLNFLTDNYTSPSIIRRPTLYYS